MYEPSVLIIDLTLRIAMVIENDNQNRLEQKNVIFWNKIYMFNRKLSIQHKGTKYISVFDSMLYVHGRQLWPCWDSQLPIHTDPRQASRWQLSIHSFASNSQSTSSAEEGNHFYTKQVAQRATIAHLRTSIFK